MRKGYNYNTVAYLHGRLLANAEQIRVQRLEETVASLSTHRKRTDWAAEAAAVGASEPFEYGSCDAKETYMATGSPLWARATAEEQLAVIDAFCTNASVETVEMVNAGVTDALAAAWGRVLARNARLTTLNLESNSISTAGMEALAAGLRSNATLRELKLANQHTSFTQALEPPPSSPCRACERQSE